MTSADTIQFHSAAHGVFQASLDQIQKTSRAAYRMTLPDKHQAAMDLSGLDFTDVQSHMAMTIVLAELQYGGQ